MCMLCIEFMKEKMTLREAYSAAREMINTADSEEEINHLKKIIAALQEDMKRLNMNNPGYWV